MTDTTNAAHSLIQNLHAKSPADQIHLVLEAIATISPDPITLDQFLREIAKRVQTGLKAVRQTYDMVLKKLNIKPVDLGLAIARELLQTVYNDGISLKMMKDGFLHSYESTHWVPMSEHKIRANLQAVAVKYKGLTDKTLHALVNDSLGSLKDYLGSNQDVLSLVDEPLPVINCLNGELWIDKDGKAELRPHKPESHLFYCLPYVYDDKATCPVFDKAVLEIFAEAQEPKEMRRHAYEMLGYMIQPCRPIPCFWLMIGHGANGKTKFLQTACRLIGQDYLHNIDMSSFGKDKFSMSQLRGKLVMIDDDIKMDTIIPDGLLKKISETKPLSARQPYGKQSITFLNTAMPIMVGNHYPLCEDLSQGLLRRAMVIPFRRQFKLHEQDTSKFEHIWANEMPGVLNRAIEGYQRVVKRKRFDPPQECLEARHEFLAHGNPLYCFLSECVEKQDGSRIPLPQLRLAYETWAKEQNISRMSVLNKTLKRRLQALGYEIGIHDGYPCLIGYKLKSADEK